MAFAPAVLLSPLDSGGGVKMADREALETHRLARLVTTDPSSLPLDESSGNSLIPAQTDLGFSRDDPRQRDLERQTRPVTPRSKIPLTPIHDQVAENPTGAQ